VHWIYDAWALANGTANAIVKRGGDSWFFLTADYTFGYALERDTEAVVVKSGGKVLGKVRHPFPGTNFSSFLLQAKASKAKIIGLPMPAATPSNSMKQSSEFGLAEGGQKLAGLLIFISYIHALGASRLPRASSSPIRGTGTRLISIGHSRANTSQHSAVCRATRWSESTRP
jgi:branched-chain amino acid transport system substrate-binding protein